MKHKNCYEVIFHHRKLVKEKETTLNYQYQSNCSITQKTRKEPNRLRLYHQHPAQPQQVQDRFWGYLKFLSGKQELPKTICRDLRHG
jgi:hypothetical protein